MATNLPSCFFIQFLEQLLKFLENFTLLKYVKSQRSYGFLITKELIFGFQILDLKDHFSASLSAAVQMTIIVLADYYYQRSAITRYSKNPYIRVLNFEGQAPVGSYIMIKNPNIRLLGS